MDETVKRFYQSHVCLAGAGIADVEPEVPFIILGARFGEFSYDIVPNKHIATAKQNLTSLIESHISHGEILRLLTDAP